MAEIEKLRCAIRYDEKSGKLAYTLSSELYLMVEFPPLPTTHPDYLIKERRLCFGARMADAKIKKNLLVIFEPVSKYSNVLKSCEFSLSKHHKVFVPLFSVLN